MVIDSLYYLVGDSIDKEEKSCKLEGIDRKNYMTMEYLKLVKGYLKELLLEGKSAFLLAGGPVIHHSEGRNVKDTAIYSDMAIKSQLGFNLFRVLKAINQDFDYVNINGNTCASSMHSIYEAYDLIHNKGYDSVVIYASDLVEPSQLELFKQLGIDIMCGDGLVVAVIKKTSSKPLAEIDQAVWTWNNDLSPMTVSEKGYTKMLDKLVLEDIDVVKPHGTKTDRNDLSENVAIEKKLGDKPMFTYKETVGHTQGASALIEIGLLLKDINSGDKALVTASGLGGFYGGCTLTKR